VWADAEAELRNVIFGRLTMAGWRRPQPVGTTQDGFDTETLARSQSPSPGPVCSLRIEDMIAESISLGSYSAPKGQLNSRKSESAIASAQMRGKRDPAIELLNLSAAAKEAAYELKRKHPSVVFTSGLRNRADQARAMASNVVDKRQWIRDTYSDSPVRVACQKWVDQNPQARTKREIAHGLKSVLESFTDAQLIARFRHLSGNAFDVQPVEKFGEEIKETLRSLAHRAKKHGHKQAIFLEKEGGKTRWHIQF
jgi:hypothetical protein